MSTVVQINMGKFLAQTPPCAFFNKWRIPPSGTAPYQFIYSFYSWPIPRIFDYKDSGTTNKSLIWDGLPTKILSIRENCFQFNMPNTLFPKSRNRFNFKAIFTLSAWCLPKINKFAYTKEKTTDINIMRFKSE